MRKVGVRMSLKWGTATLVVMATASQAQAKTLIDYFLPTPIVCPLTSNTWGAAGVVPRDVCNGLEDSTGTQWQYWDGKIMVGTDGKYHIFAGRWPQNKGFADWPNSVIVQGVSNSTIMGSYVPSAATPFAGKEQNVTGMVLNDGTFALLDSPGNVFTAPSLDGPWAALGAIQVAPNGFVVSKATTENQTIWPSADGSFLVISRTFQEMVSAKNILGPYPIQATVPNLQSQGYEDPVIWCSGGQYHMVANMYNARKAMHFTSVDGIHNWTNVGLAYDPTADFVRYTDGTINHWYKAERPGVVMENGHVTAFSFAVIDVDKAMDLANDTHGSKIIVVPFDGVTFDRENPGPGSAGCPLGAGASVDGGQPVDAGSLDSGKRADSGGGDAGGSLDASVSLDADGTVDAAVSVDAGEIADAGGSLDVGEFVDAGGSLDASGAGDAGGLADAEGQGGTQEGGSATDAGGGGGASAGGCSCRIGRRAGSNAGAEGALLVAAALAGRWRRKTRR